MAEVQDTPSGPDLTQGVAEQAVSEGALLLGHVAGEPVMLTRCQGEIVAVGARCPHYGGPLNEGLIVGDTVRCPWHHATFNLRTGDMLRPPALGDLPCWKVAKRDGMVVVTEKREAARSQSANASQSGAPESVVIIGGGAAGAVAAQTLRREGYDRPITIIGADVATPCDRPNLSKDYLAGNAPEEWIPLHPDSFYQDQQIQLVLGKRVTAIDTATRRVVLDDRTTVEFGALLIATGATPVQLDIATHGRPIHYLRTLADSRAIINAANGAKHAVVLGSSFIGLEVAASLRARGLGVTVVGPEARPLERVLGPALGDAIRALHEQHGVNFRLGQTASLIDQTGVVLQNGDRLNADLVVAGIGVRPETALAESAGLATDHGIVVNEYLETSVPGIYAAGDVARWPDPHTGERIRVEHWVVAERQGQAAAHNMLAGAHGDRRRFDSIPFFWSQHYDVTIAYVGHATRWDTIDIDGDVMDHDCSLTYRLNGRVMAVATISRDRANLEAEVAMERDVASGVS